MEKERLYDLNELRVRQLERLASSLLEGQQAAAQPLTEHTKRFIRVDRRLDSLDKRMERVENLLTLVLAVLAFIKEIRTQQQKALILSGRRKGMRIAPVACCMPACSGA